MTKSVRTIGQVSAEHRDRKRPSLGDPSGWALVVEGLALDTQTILQCSGDTRTVKTHSGLFVFCYHETKFHVKKPKTEFLRGI